ASGPLADLLVDRPAGVEYAAGVGLGVGMDALVERMAGHRGRRAALVWVHRLQLDVVVGDRADNRLLGHRRGTDERRALERLAEVVAEALWETGSQRQRGVDRVVAGATGDHDVGALVERFPVGLDAHHGDDAGGLVEDLAGQRSGRTERLDLLVTNALAQV